MVTKTTAAFMLLLLAKGSGASGQAAEDAVRITFLGTGAPRPSLARYGPGILVEAGDERFLLDAGSGVRERLYEAGSFDLIVGLDRIFITHLHYDHTVDLADLWLTGWLYGRRVPLVVQGPMGTKAMAEDLQRAFQWDVEYRVLVGVPREGASIEAHDVAPGVVFDRNGLKVTALLVEHMPIDLDTRERLDFWGETYGYRVDYRGRSVVFSGDTRASDNLVESARGVDVLVHEVQVPSPGMSKETQLANVSLSVHAAPEEVAAVFRRAKPRLAVYSHIVPPHVTAEELVAATRPGYDGPLTVAHDLMMLIVGDEITVTERPRRKEEVFETSGVVK